MIVDVEIRGERSKMQRAKELIETLLNDNLPYAEINVETYPAEDSETTTALFNNMMGKPLEISGGILESMKYKGRK